MCIDDAFKRAVAFALLIFLMSYIGIEITTAASILSNMTVNNVGR